MNKIEEKLLIFVQTYKPTKEDLLRLMNKTECVSEEDLDRIIKTLKRERLIFGSCETGITRYSLTREGVIKMKYVEKVEKIVSVEANNIIKELGYDLRVEGSRLKSGTLTRTEINEIAKEISRLTTDRIKEKYNAPEEFEVFFNCDCDVCDEKDTCPQRLRELSEDY